MTTSAQTMTASQEISRRILVLIADGVDALEAVKQVCGADQVEAMISDLYDALRR